MAVADLAKAGSVYALAAGRRSAQNLKNTGLQSCKKLVIFVQKES